MAASEHRRQPHRPRFPSLTQFPDSPSVYSHAYISPDPDTRHVDDESASTISTDGPHDDDDDDDIGDLTDDASHRISLQGPKIRFHSRAPWETDSEDLPNHLENNPKPPTAPFKLKPKSSKTDNLIRNFTRGSAVGGRPSVDSTHSQVSTVSSFDVIAGNYSGSRGGALYDLARQMSSSSLTSTLSASSLRPHAVSRGAIHAKSPQYYTQPHDMMSRAVSLDAMVPSSTNFENIPLRSASSDISRVAHQRNARSSILPPARERQPHDQFVHPYANPDLAFPYTPSPETIPNDSVSEDMTASDSVSTVTDTASTISAAFSTTSNEPSTSLSQSDVPHATLRVNGREISSPISILHQGDSGYVDRNTRFLALHPPPVGFDGPLRNSLGSRTPTVTLISLQEAQARERFRSSTVHTTARQKPLGPDDIPEVLEDGTAEMDFGGRVSHTRVRSSSAGTRYNPPSLPPPAQLQSADETTVSPPSSAGPGRALKHKKSGFMRLFGGRVTEGEKERSPPLPIPPVGDVYAEEPLQIYKTSKPMLPRAQKSSPALRSGVSNATLSSVYSDPSGLDDTDGKAPSPRRRQPPLLSIVTKTSDPVAPSSLVETSPPAGLSIASSLLTVPQSAPPGNGNFPGLKLRPVSTSFGSHFADMVADTGEESQRDVRTPSSAASSSTVLSPFTPVSTRRSDDASSTAVEALGDDHLTIKGLQDQLVSAKLAWQQQIWELRGQIRDLTSELEEFRAADNQEYCEICGRGEPRSHHPVAADEHQRKKISVVNRPRVRTGDTARFANGNN